MTLRREREVIDTLKGTGQVRRKGEVIAEASYSLSIEKGATIAKSFKGDRQTRLAHKSVSGEVTVLSGNIVPGGVKTPCGPFTLVIEDGREVDFYIDEYTVDSESCRQKCRISGAGGRL